MKWPVGWMAMKFLLKLRTTRGQYCSITVRGVGGGGYFLKWPIRGSSAQKRYLFQASGIWKGKRIKGLFVVASELSSVSSYFTGTPLIQIIKMQHNRIKNPKCQEATSWLFTSVAEDLNSVRPRTNPASGQSGTRTQGRRIASPTRWPLGHAVSLSLIPCRNFTSWTISKGGEICHFVP